MDRLEQVLDDFSGDLKRAEHLLRLVKGFRTFGGSVVPPAVKNGTAPWAEAADLWDESKELRTYLPILSGSLLLYLAGRFEYFMQQLVQTVAEDIVEGASVYSDLPDALRKELTARTLEVAQNPRKFGFSEGQGEAFIVSLAANVSGGNSPLSISSEVLTITDTNMKDRVVAKLLKRVGMEGVWRDLGKQAPMKLHLDISSDRAATAAAQGRLNALMDERNQIAHPTLATQFPDPDQVLERAAFLRKLAEVMTQIVQVYLAGFTNKDGDQQVGPPDR